MNVSRCDRCRDQLFHSVARVLMAVKMLSEAEPDVQVEQVQSLKTSVEQLLRLLDRTPPVKSG